jgi:hypothetical protein
MTEVLFVCRFALVTFTLALAAFGFASDDASQTSTEIGFFAGKGAKILGSSDIRAGGGLSYAYAKPEPRFKFGRGIRAQLVWQGYVDYTNSIGYIHPRYSTFATGAIAYARWWGQPFSHGPKLYTELGEGLQIASQPTYDLPSDMNSTPILGVGFAVPFAAHDCLFGVRLLHISNAGFVSPNRGNDELFFTAAISF